MVLREDKGGASSNVNQKKILCVSLWAPKVMFWPANCLASAVYTKRIIHLTGRESNG